MCICACVCMSMNQGESHRMHMMHRASCGGVGAGGGEVKIFAVSICSTQERRLANSQANISSSFCFVLFYKYWSKNRIENKINIHSEVGSLTVLRRILYRMCMPQCALTF